MGDRQHRHRSRRSHTSGHRSRSHRRSRRNKSMHHQQQIKPIETTYGQDFLGRTPKADENARRIMAKFSNRVAQTPPPGSLEMKDGKKFLKHRYDYDNAKLSSGNAFNVTTKHLQNEYVDYNQYYMGRPGRRAQVDKMIKYKYPKCVDTNY